MVKVRMMDKSGDKVQTMTLEEAKEVVEDNLAKGNIVYDEVEKKVITKATMGQVKEESEIGVVPAIQGG